MVRAKIWSKFEHLRDISTVKVETGWGRERGNAGILFGISFEGINDKNLLQFKTFFMKVINDIARVLLLFILFMLGNHFVPGQDYDQNGKIDLGFDSLSFADILKIQYDSPLPPPNYNSPLGFYFMPGKYFVVRQDYDQNRKMDLGFDTLKSGYPSGIKFDSVQIELFHNGKRFAIVPDDLKQEIDDSQVSSTKFIIEKLNDNRILLRILKFMEFK